MKVSDVKAACLSALVSRYTCHDDINGRRESGIRKFPCHAAFSCHSALLYQVGREITGAGKMTSGSDWIPVASTNIFGRGTATGCHSVFPAEMKEYKRKLPLHGFWMLRRNRLHTTAGAWEGSCGRVTEACLGLGLDSDFKVSSNINVSLILWFCECFGMWFGFGFFPLSDITETWIL